MNPIISVVLPVYNAEKYLACAINSILGQTFPYFELLIINDGSDDGTESVIKLFKDKRIRYIRNESNLGLIATLNKGISFASGKYIARMDADDISRPERFEKQVKFLEENTDYVICSSARTEFTDNFSFKHNSYLPVDDISIRISSVFSTPFTHPSVMFRREVFIENNLEFDFNYKYAEDYDLWIKFLSYGKGYNFGDILLEYRNTPSSQTSIGSSRIQERKKIISKIQQKALANVGLNLSPKDLNFLFILSLSDHISKIDFQTYTISYINIFFHKLQTHFEQLYPKDKSKVHSVLGKRYLKIIVFNRKTLKFSQIINFSNFKLIIAAVKNIYNERRKV